MTNDDSFESAVQRQLCSIAKMTKDDSFESAVQRQLCSIAKIDADQRLADIKLLFTNAIYKSIAVKSSLQSFTVTMVELQW